MANKFITALFGDYSKKEVKRLGKTKQKVLDLLKQAQVNIPLKAVVTPANRSWVFGDLLAHLQEEHTAFTAAKENQTR